MGAEIGKSGFKGGKVFGVQIRFGNAAVHLQRAHRGDEDDGIGIKPRFAGKDVKELFGSEVGAETGFGYDIICQRQSGACGDDRTGAVGNVGERAAVDEGGGVFQRLHQIGQHGILEDGRHGTGGV